MDAPPEVGGERSGLAQRLRSERVLADERVEEIERRIAALEELDDSALGRFTGWDWLCCVLGGLVAPIAVLWWFAG